MCSTRYSPHCRYFLERGFRVILPDLPSVSNGAELDGILLTISNMIVWTVYWYPFQLDGRSFADRGGVRRSQGPHPGGCRRRKEAKRRILDRVSRSSLVGVLCHQELTRDVLLVEQLWEAGLSFITSSRTLPHRVSARLYPRDQVAV
jgi:hypothetical protein